MTPSCLINGIAHSIPAAWKARTLLEYLREELDLTGAKNGCGIGVCGSCTVLLDGKAVRACKTALSSLDGKSILTIEGLTPAAGGLHPLQQAFVDHGAIQCGFCTPGMLLSAHAVLLTNPHPTSEEIRRGINANLCRCTGYQQIVEAIEAVAESGFYSQNGGNNASSGEHDRVAWALSGTDASNGSGAQPRILKAKTSKARK